MFHQAKSIFVKILQSSDTEFQNSLYFYNVFWRWKLQNVRRNIFYAGHPHTVTGCGHHNVSGSDHYHSTSGSGQVTVQVDQVITVKVVQRAIQF